MRNLSIRRTKSFVGCLVNMRVYIEDHTFGDLVINGVPCRKLGKLKNGEEKTFQIEENASKVYVIADKISKNYCNEYYQLPEGEDDVFLSGKNKFNPASGNAFRFDNNNSEDVLRNRKSGTRKGLLVLIAAVLIGAIVGFLIGSDMLWVSTPKAKIFSQDGMSITLTDEFFETDIENYTVAYDSKDVGVFVLKEEFSYLPEGFENHSLEQYAELVIQANELSSVQVITDEGLTFFEYDYTNPETHDNYQFFSYVYKSSDAFWLVQFTTLDKNAGDYMERITEWAKSVEFLV